MLIPLAATIGARDQHLKSCGTVGDRIKEVIGDRREERSEEKTGDGDE